MSRNDLNQALKEAVDALIAGETVGLPTETVYGLAADARRPESVARIFQIKNRPFFDPLIVHVAALEEVEKYVESFPPEAQRLAEHFWPGPLTLILPKKPCIPDLVTSGLPDVAIRIPDHPLALALLREFAGPLAAPSANKFGRISPTSAQAVRDELGTEIRIVLDGGPCRVGIESTIVQVGPEPPAILRQGGISQEDIEKALGKKLASGREGSAVKLAPGMLDQHYAPRTPLRLLDQSRIGQLSIVDRQRVGLLTWGPDPADGFAAVRNLSPLGSMVEGAVSLFHSLRELDGLGLLEIIARPWPEKELGRAINDRLRRASHK